MKFIGYEKVTNLLLHFRESLGVVEQKTGIADKIIHRDQSLEAAADVAAIHISRTATWPEGLKSDLIALLFWRCQYAIECVEETKSQLPPMPEQMLSPWVESLLTEDWRKEGKDWFIHKFAPGFAGQI